MTDRCKWRRRDVLDASKWTHHLGDAELADLRETLARLRDRRLDSLAPCDVPGDGPLARAARRWRDELADGLGFVLVRGFPVDGFPLGDLASAYAVLGLHLGTPVPQNLSGQLVADVRDTGADPALPRTRLYTTRAEQDFHTDGADIIGLLCRRGARSGGASRIVSSGAIVAEIERVRPDLVPTLFEDFPWHYQEDGHPAMWFSRPICTAPAGGERRAPLNTFFIPWYIRRSQELAGAPRLTRAQSEAIALIEQLANDRAFYLDMTFEPGDVQWLKNAAILHKRTAYEDHDRPDHKRHLLRLWLSAPEFTDGDAQLRRGVIAGSATER